MINQPEIGDRVLSLLHQYGWEMGLQKLREEIAATPDAEARDNLLFFAGWMAAGRGAMMRRGRCSRTPERVPRPDNGSASSGRCSRCVSSNSRRRRGCSIRSSPRRRARPSGPRWRNIRGAVAFHASERDRAHRELREALRLLGMDR